MQDFRELNIHGKLALLKGLTDYKGASSAGLLYGH
jgi:hypothetical protein